jgi:hypothetical protein
LGSVANDPNRTSYRPLFGALGSLVTMAICLWLQSWLFVVFALKGFIQNLLGAGIEGSNVATVTHTDHDHGAATDVAFIAPLTKFHKLSGLDDFALSAEFTNFSPHPTKSISES